MLGFQLELQLGLEDCWLLLLWPMVLAHLLGLLLELVLPLLVSPTPSELEGGEQQASADLLVIDILNVTLLVKAIHLPSLGAQYPNQPVTY